MNDLQAHLPVYTILLYFLIFVAFLFSEKFREDFGNWLALKDPIGLKFWASHPIFLIISLLFAAVFALLVILGE